MEKQAKKNLIIRLIVYPIVILIAGGLSFYLYYRYKEEHPEPKLIGVEFCATPEEAVHKYAEALIKADREEALKYVYKPLRDIQRWEADRNLLYSLTDEKLKEYGEDLLGGYLKEKWQTGWGGGAEWVVELIFQGEKAKSGTILVNTVNEGWKID